MSDILDAPTLPCAHCSAPVMFGGMRHLKGEMVCRYCYEKAHEELPVLVYCADCNQIHFGQCSMLPPGPCAICGWDHDATVCPQRPGGEAELPVAPVEDGLCYGCDCKVPLDVLFEYQGQTFCPLCCDTLQSVVLRTGKEPAL